MTNSIRTLYVVRKGYPFTSSSLGYVATIPTFALPEGEVSESALADDLVKLGEVLRWSHPVPPGAHIDRIMTVGVVAPDAWEECYIRWLSDALGAPVTQSDEPWPEKTASPGPASVSACLDSSGGGFWRSPADVPEGVTLVRAETRRGEARHAARTIRSWLHSKCGSDSWTEACDQILVLLPSDPSFVSLWSEVFRRHELPVRTVTFRSLALLPLAQWVMDLAQLAGWSETSGRPRSLLQRVLTSRFWSGKAVRTSLGLGDDVYISRRVLAERLRALRRPTVNLDEWRRHLRAVPEEQDASRDPMPMREPLVRMTDALAKALDTGHLAAALEGLFPSAKAGGAATGLKLGVSGATRLLYSGSSDDPGDSSDAEEAGTELARVSAALTLVANAKPDGPGNSAQSQREQQVALLREALEDLFVADRTDPEHGVTFLPYQHYDHRKTELLFLAGLGEGQFPTVVPLPSKREAGWLRSLGMLASTDNAADWVVRHAEGQIRVARAALLQAGEVVMSFATEGRGTGDVHPGSLLTLLAGSWDDSWSGNPGRVAVVSAGSDIPVHIGEASNWQEARQFTRSEEIRASLVRATEGNDLAGQRARTMTSLEESLASSRAADDEKTPTGPSCAGPYSGHLPGRTRPEEGSGVPLPTYSPTSLEAFGECPYKYFLGRILGLESAGDAEDDLSAMETGNTIHAAFTQAARKVIKNLDGAVWDLTYEGGDSKEAKEANREVKTAEVMAILTPHVEGALVDAATSQPTLCEPLIKQVGHRWVQALHNWVHQHIRERIPARLTPEAIDQAPEVGTELANLARARQETEKVAEEFAEAVRDRAGKDPKGGVTVWTKKWATATREKQGEVGESLRSCFSELKEGMDPEELIVAFCEERRHKAEEIALARVSKARRTEEAKQHEAGTARRVAFAELAFGTSKGGDCDPHSVPDYCWNTVCGDGRTVQVAGKIDRVDWDADRSFLAVRDYKSGKHRSQAALEGEIRSGLHLQLLLYACALEELFVQDGRIPWITGSRVRNIALEFPKTAKEAELHFQQMVAVAVEAPVDASDRETDAVAPTTEVSWRDIVMQWLEYITRGIELGSFDRIPQRCPLAGGARAYCDFKRICGYSKGHAAFFAVPDRRPSFPKPPKEKKGTSTKGRPPELLVPSLPADPSSPDRDREIHRKGQELALGIGQSVIVSAGAGTGKTWNLVRRYLQALKGDVILKEGAAPEEILCVTFTRKAAAEMQQRVRAGLMVQAQELAAGSLTDTLRRTILTLSAAPIWTLDSLGLHLIQTVYEAENAASGMPTGPVPDVDPTGAQAELEIFLSDRFLRGVSDGNDDLEFLLSHVTVRSLRTQFEEVIKGACTIPDAAWPSSSQVILEQWMGLFQPIMDRVREGARKRDLDEWERIFRADHEGGNVHADCVTAMEDSLRSARALASREPLSIPEFLAALKTLSGTPKNVTQVSLRSKSTGERSELYLWLDGSGVADLPQEVLGKNSKSYEAYESIRVHIDQFPTYAEISYRMLKVARAWADEFQERLIQKGTLRYGDVETLACRMLEAPERRDILAERFPFKHVFVDESQDTSERQAQLVDGLAKLTKAKVFWVGDPKQSIYRFRGAEVDVFEQRVRRASPDSELVPASLRVNRRSHPRLIEAINRLFGAMFSANADGVALDPGSEVQFEPQTWPPTHKVDGEEVAWELEAEEPRIEWIVDLGSSHQGVITKEVRDQDEEERTDSAGNRNEEEEDERPRTASAEAVVVRIRQLLEERATRGTVPSGYIALLVGTWAGASSWREELVRQGIPCAVQGGGGLLKTPEADLLRMWIEAQARLDDLALAGAMRGPGIAISDVGLFCLRKGHGLTLTDFSGNPVVGTRGFSLRRAMEGQLDPAAATQAWDQASGLANRELALELLTRDAASLKRFKGIWKEFSRRIAVHSTADTLDWLMGELALDAYWGGKEGGRQAMANLQAVVAVVREYEQSQGCSPLRLLHHLDSVAGSDDPASGGLDAGSGTPVIITTAWQAKGREWPIVILPSVHDFKTRADAAGMKLRRIVGFDLGSGRRQDPPMVQYVPEVIATTSKAPFEATIKPVSALLDVYSAPVNRAELRRLLYVAMTRAKDRLILVGTHKPLGRDKGIVWTEKVGEGKVNKVTLDSARNWGDLLVMCTGFSLETVASPDSDPGPDGHPGQPGRPVLSGDGAWRTQDVILTTTEELSKTVFSPVPDAAPPAFDPSIVQLWQPVASRERGHITPSKMPGHKVVPHPRLDGGCWPGTSGDGTHPFGRWKDAGIAFHRLMELWGFGANC